jgi:uncharacterized protein YbjT (DUF2867 family)
MATVLVTGGSGKTGSEIARQLAAKGVHVRAASRSPHASDGNITHVLFDYRNKETFAGALAGVEAVALIAPPLDPGAFALMQPFIDAAIGAKARIVMISAVGMNAMPEVGLGKIEVYLKKHAPAYTILRPNFFMENFTTGFLGGMLKKSGGLYLSAAEGKSVFVAVHDIAAVAVQALLDRKHKGKEYEVTGPEALTHTEALAIINKALGTSYVYTPISHEALKKGALEGGMPEPVADMFVGLYRATAAGLCGKVSRDVELVTGVKPLTFAEFLKRG